MSMPMLNSNFGVLRSDPIEIFEALEAKFGNEPWLSWDSETLLMQLPLLTDSVVQDKILAVKACAFNPKVTCTVALAFEKTCKAFCNNVCIMDEYQPLFIEEVFYGVGQIAEIMKKVHDVAPDFTGEVPGYIAAVAKVRSFSVLPKRLAFAEGAVENLVGYTPNPDEMELVNSLDALPLEAMKDPKVLDNLNTEHSQQDALVARLIGCYLYDPK